MLLGAERAFTGSLSTPFAFSHALHPSSSPKTRWSSAAPTSATSPAQQRQQHQHDQQIHSIVGTTCLAYHTKLAGNQLLQAAAAAAAAPERQLQRQAHRTAWTQHRKHVARRIALAAHTLFPAPPRRLVRRDSSAAPGGQEKKKPGAAGAAVPHQPTDGGLARCAHPTQTMRRNVRPAAVPGGLPYPPVLRQAASPFSRTSGKFSYSFRRKNRRKETRETTPQRGANPPSRPPFGRSEKPPSNSPAVETPSFSMILTPSLPPHPRTRSTGRLWNTLSTLSSGSTVWAFGLCMPLHSLARSLLCATPGG